VDDARYWHRERLTDLAMLPTAQQSWSELARVSADAEADVIRQFTRETGDVLAGGWYDAPEFTAVGETRGVFLRYYEADASTVVDGAASTAVQQDQAAFLVAMKRTIVAVISWRFLAEKRDPALDQESDGTGRHRTMNVHHAEPFPLAWDRWLRPFVTLPPAGATRY
jgi:hypothetical protein